MGLVIQVGEEEDLAEKPEDWPQCYSWPKRGSKSSTKDLTAGIQSSNSDAYPRAYRPESIYKSTTTKSGTDMGTVQVLLAVALAVMSTIVVVLSVYTIRIRHELKNMSAEKTPLLHSHPRL